MEGTHATILYAEHSESRTKGGAAIPRVEEVLRIKNDGTQTDEVGLQEDRR